MVKELKPKHIDGNNVEVIGNMKFFPSSEKYTFSKQRLRGGGKGERHRGNRRSEHRIRFHKAQYVYLRFKDMGLLDEGSK